MDDQEEKIQEGEIVEETGSEPQETESQVSTPTSTDQTNTTILESLESLIRENLAKVDKLSQDAAQQKEMIDSVLENDETYKQHADAVKAATKIKTATKQEILKRPDVSHINLKVKELDVEIKEIKESMNSYLQEYQRLSGSTEIEDDKGQVMQIVYTAKLIKRRG